MEERKFYRVLRGSCQLQTHNNRIIIIHKSQSWQKTLYFEPVVTTRRRRPAFFRKLHGGKFKTLFFKREKIRETEVSERVTSQCLFVFISPPGNNTFETPCMQLPIGQKHYVELVKNRKAEGRLCYRPYFVYTDTVSCKFNLTR